MACVRFSGYYLPETEVYPVRTASLQRPCTMQAPITKELRHGKHRYISGP